MSIAKKMGKSLSNEYGQKRLDCAKKSTTDAIKTASKRAIQKTADATGVLIGNKIADKITSVSKKSSAENSMNELNCKKPHSDDEIEVPEKRYISPEREKIIDKLRLV